MNSITKKCTKCGEEKKLSDFHKYKDGLRARCKSCHGGDNKEYVSRNKEKVKDASRTRYLQNSSEIKQRAKKYYIENAGEIIKRVKEWAKNNKEKRSEILKKYYIKNKDTVIKKAQEWKLINPEKSKQSKKKYEINNLEKIRESQKTWNRNNLDKKRKLAKIWRKNNPEKLAEYRYKRAFAISGAGGIITAKEWRDLKDVYNNTCLCCKKKEPEIKLELDHVIPVSHGGSNTIDNIQPLCRSCNARKKDKYIDYR